MLLSLVAPKFCTVVSTTILCIVTVYRYRVVCTGYQPTAPYRRINNDTRVQFCNSAWCMYVCMCVCMVVVIIVFSTGKSVLVS